MSFYEGILLFSAIFNIFVGCCLIGNFRDLKETIRIYGIDVLDTVVKNNNLEE